MDGIFSTAKKAILKRKERNDSAAPKDSPSLAKDTVDTSKITAKNPNTIKNLTPAESTSSLAQARARQKARVNAAKQAQELARQRRVKN